MCIRDRYELGIKYATGAGVSEDDVEAVKWYRMAAKQGYAKGQYNLGIKYATGEGVPQDSIKAYMWTSLAQTEGLSGVEDVKNDLVTKMTIAEISTAKEMARVCYESQYENC